MLTKLTEKVIVLTLQNNQQELVETLKDLPYQDLITLYAMCLNLSKTVREAPNFNKGPTQS